MSFQAPPQQQPQQPVQVYPTTTVTNQPPSHHSNGSFGTVFIVLAIILVISVVACVLGRLCNRRYSNKHNHNYNRNHHQSQRHVVMPNRHQQIHNMNSPREEDIEFGVDHKRIPTPTIARPINGHGMHGAGTGPQLQPHANGTNNIKRFEMKDGHEGELRADA